MHVNHFPQIDSIHSNSRSTFQLLNFMLIFELRNPMLLCEYFKQMVMRILIGILWLGIEVFNCSPLGPRVAPFRLLQKSTVDVLLQFSVERTHYVR